MYTLFLFFVLVAHGACSTLVLQSGAKLMTPALEAQGFNHWTARGVLFMYFFFFNGSNITGFFYEVSSVELPGYYTHWI